MSVLKEIISFILSIITVFLIATSIASLINYHSHKYMTDYGELKAGYRCTYGVVRIPEEGQQFDQNGNPIKCWERIKED